MYIINPIYLIKLQVKILVKFLNNKNVFVDVKELMDNHCHFALTSNNKYFLVQELFFFSIIQKEFVP